MGGGGGGSRPIGLTNEQLGQRIIKTYSGMPSQTEDAPCLAQELKFTTLGENAVHLFKRTVAVQGDPEINRSQLNEAVRRCGRTGCEVTCDLFISGSRAELQQADLETGTGTSQHCEAKNATIFMFGQH